MTVNVWRSKIEDLRDNRRSIKDVIVDTVGLFPNSDKQLFVVVNLSIRSL